MHRNELYQGPSFPLLFGNPGSKVTSGTAVPVKHTAREVAPARTPSPHGGPKACTQCGTTRTPQWREGPAGPKTLCNACGVKLVRKNRSSGEAAKRRASPPRAAEKPLQLNLLDRGTPSPEPWSGVDSGADELVVPEVRFSGSAVASGLGSKRPIRKAAARAASRTAEFASTGDWPQDAGHASLLSADGHVLFPAPPAPATSDSMDNSDSAEEVAWAPQSIADTATAGKHAAPSNTCQDTSAAVNLLTMSFDHDSNAAAAVTPQTDPSVSHQDPQAATPSRARLNFLKANCALSVSEQAIEDALRSSLPARFAEYEAMQARAELAWRQSAASEAAVAAVARFLAQKQVAAIKAHEAARFATQQLHDFLHQSHAELGMPRAWKRQRT